MQINYLLKVKIRFQLWPDKPLSTYRRFI